MTGNLLKKSSGFILLCSISLLMLVMTGCQEAKLKTVIGVANKQCPIDMGAVGTITSIIYDGNNVVYTLNMNEEITNIKILKDNPESMKSSITMMFQNPAADGRKRSRSERGYCINTGKSDRSRHPDIHQNLCR